MVDAASLEGEMSPDRAMLRLKLLGPPPDNFCSGEAMEAYGDTVLLVHDTGAGLNSVHHFSWLSPSNGDAFIATFRET